MRAPPGSTVSEYGVEDHEQLPHARHQSHLLGLADLNESFVELLDGGVESRGDQGSHVEYLPNLRPAAPHRASASQSTGVPVQRSDADERRELPRRKRAKLGQLGEKRPAQDRTHSGHASEKGFIPFEGRTSFDDFLEISIRARELLLEPLYVGFDASADGFGGTGPEAVFLGGHHPNDLPSPGEDLLELPGLFIGDGPGGGTDGLREASEHEGVYPVGLGELARGFGEVSGLARVEHEEGHSRGGQSRYRRTLEASAGFQDHQDARELFCELAQKFIDSPFVVGYYEVFFGGEDGDIQGDLRDVYPHVVGSSSTSSAQANPPLDAPAKRPNLAGAGSGSSTAQATVRAPLPEVIEGRGDPGFLAVSFLGPRNIRSTAPIPTDSRQKPKHKEQKKNGQLAIF
jgi:hypothetical protein